MSLAERFQSGDRRALSRVLSLAEREDPEFPDLFDTLRTKPRAIRIGVTGPAGAGKSTLVAELVRASRAAQRTVAVVAVDPTSPFTGGALLGDRVRMQDHTLDKGVFIRSMATRGALGGLCRKAVEIADLFDAFGFDEVIVETVGVGQIEHDIIEASDLVAVVLHPGAGDSVQALKADLLELADVFVLNKADQPGAPRLKAELEEMMQLRSYRHGESIPICKTVASRGEGIGELVAALADKRAELAANGELERRQARRRMTQLERIVEHELSAKLWGREGFAARARQLMGDRELVAPYRIAKELVGALLEGVH